MQDLPIIDISVMLTYLVLMAGVGAVVKGFSADISDYFRAGSKGTWWLVGSSVFMGGFTAVTFTGIAGQAFLGGWSVITIFWAGVVSGILEGIFLAPRFRRIRAITGLDVNFQRYGRLTEQIYGYIGVPTGSLWSALQLLGLSIFASAIFNIPVPVVIVAVGIVIVTYSVTGGSWAVLSTDFLQALILLPTTVAVALLALGEVGGLTGLFDSIKSAGLTDEFAIIKGSGFQPKIPGAVVVVGSFTLGWTFMQYIGSTVNAFSLQQAYKWFAVKDGREARRGAFFAAGLRFAGSFIFFIPPIVARLLMPEKVMSIEGILNPADASYAIISMELLPAGLIGLVLVAMFTATMSTMDTGMTANAGNITKNIYPVIIRAFGKEPREGDDLLRLGRLVNLVLGCVAIIFALYMYTYGARTGLFGIMLDLGALIGVPMSVPFFWGLFIRKTPEWSALAAIATGMIASSFCFFAPGILDIEISWQLKWIIVFSSGSIGYLLSIPFYTRSSRQYRERVDKLFESMRTPVDFEREVGQANDDKQFKVLGSFGLIIGCLLLVLLTVNQEIRHIVTILGISFTIIAVSSVFLWRSKQIEKQTKR